MHLLGISGSLRAASLNTQLVQNAADIFAPEHFTLADLNLPLYSGDVEAEGIPPAVQTLSDQIAAADAVIIATPEYNKNLSGVLKNALDWVSRTEGKPWAKKPVVFTGRSAGRCRSPRSPSADRSIRSRSCRRCAGSQRNMACPSIWMGPGSAMPWWP